MTDMTIMTATLGRPSLLKVAKCIVDQTQAANWELIFDERKAFDNSYFKLKADPVFAALDPLISIMESSLGNNVPMIFECAKYIQTPYVCFMDDDNEFNARHVEILTNELKRGAYAVATHRLYCDENMKVIAKEHPKSELVDLNNMGMKTEILLKMADYYLNQKTNSRFPSDRHMQAFLLSQGIGIKRLNHYTVKYKMNPTYVDINEKRGKIIYETLINHTMLSPAGLGELEISEELYEKAT